MSIIYSARVTCDFKYPDDVQFCAETVDESDAPETMNVPPSIARARREAKPYGWVVAHSPSSCRYDLCAAHATKLPGVDFADWKKRS